MTRLSLLAPLRLILHLVVLRPCLKLLFGVNVTGRENLLGLDRFVIAANHNSHLDILLLSYILPVSRVLTTRVVAAEEYFARSWILHRLVDFVFRPVWIIRGAKDRDPLTGMKEALRDGGSLILFPEGTRGEPGRIGVFKAGIGRLVAESGDIPVLPVYLSGPERSLPKGSRVPLPIWNHVVIGPPRRFVGAAPEIVASLEAGIRELEAMETEHRHRRASKRVVSPMVAVLGIDGSGKSTLSRALSKALSVRGRVCLVSDRLELYENGARTELQPLLAEKARRAVGGYAKKVGSLKRYKIPKLAELLLRDHLLDQARRWYRPTITVLDGSPLLNLTAWAVLYRPAANHAEVCSKAIRVLSGSDVPVPDDDPVFRTHPELRSMKRLGLTHLKLPDVVMLLDVDPSEACRRIGDRGDRRQPHETVEKLTRLRQGYLDVCRVVRREFGIPTEILDGAGTLDALSDAALGFFDSREEAVRE